MLCNRQVDLSALNCSLVEHLYAKRRVRVFPAACQESEMYFRSQTIMCFNGITSDVQPFQCDTLQQWGLRGNKCALAPPFSKPGGLTFDRLDPVAEQVVVSESH